MDDARDHLLAIIRRDAVTHGDFVLSSGRRSSIYIDMRQVTLSAEGSYLIGRAMLALLGDEPVDAVAGLTMGADPVVSAMVVVSHLEQRPLAGLLVRKETKQHGRGRLVEGPLRAGMRVVVVEDTCTTGASALQAAAAVTDAGGRVSLILGIVDRDEGARAAIETQGYQFGHLFTLADLAE